MGCLERGAPSLEAAAAKVQAGFLKTFAYGTLFWPIANVINFQYVAPTQRVLYVNAAGVLWNTLLSALNSPNSEEGDEEGDAELASQKVAAAARRS
jgi:protein Mpv17